MGIVDQFVHRSAYGTREFESYMSLRPRGRKLPSYGTLYLAFHGSRDGLLVGAETVHLDRLGTLIGSFRGGIVHLGSCSVLKYNERGEPHAAAAQSAKASVRRSRRSHPLSDGQRDLSRRQRLDRAARRA